MTRKIMMFGLVGLVSSAGLLLSGCKTVSRDQYQAAVRENTELRERLAGIQETNRLSNDQTDEFSTANSSLAGENTRLLSELQSCETARTAAEANAASAATQIATMQGTIASLSAGGGYQVASADTGFEGIPGVRGVSDRGNSGGDFAIEIAGDVLFSSGSTKLTKKAKNSLNQIASVIKSKYGSQSIRVEGYTDSDPIKRSKWKTNRRLSSERAMAVEDYLVSRGIKDSRIYSAAYGSAAGKSNKAQSRRVEIVIMGS